MKMIYMTQTVLVPSRDLISLKESNSEIRVAGKGEPRCFTFELSSRLITNLERTLFPAYPGTWLFE
jgi:hypothetical protein